MVLDSFLPAFVAPIIAQDVPSVPTGATGRIVRERPGRRRPGVFSAGVKEHRMASMDFTALNLRIAEGEFSEERS
jgi:hypothetical protein